MVSRLVIDVVWRNRWGYALVSPIVVLWWLIYIAGGSGVFSMSMPALSLTVTAVLGPLFVKVAMSLRELRHLPITNRDLWRTTWVAAVVVAPGIVLATQTIAALLVMMFGGHSRVSAETILLSAVYDVAWAGALLPLLRLAGDLGLALDRHGTPGVTLSLAESIAVLLVCFGLPLLISDALPAHVGAITPAITGVLTGCFVIAFAALAWTPRRRGLFGVRAQARRASDLATRPARRRLADRLTGIPRVTVPGLLTTVGLAVGACLALAIYGARSGWGPGWFVPRARDLFDPMNVGESGLTYVVLVPSGVVAMLSLWTPWARLLKVLPLSVRQINALLLVTPFATWTWFWLLSLALYSLAYGAPPTLRLDLPFGLAGLAALAHAALLRVQGSSGSFLVFAAIGGLMPPLLEVGLREGTETQVAFAIIGAIALGAAALINHRTLTRSTSSSAAYRRPQSPFGMKTTARMR